MEKYGVTPEKRAPSQRRQESTPEHARDEVMDQLFDDAAYFGGGASASFDEVDFLAGFKDSPSPARPTGPDPREVITRAHDPMLPASILQSPEGWGSRRQGASGSGSGSGYGSSYGYGYGYSASGSGVLAASPPLWQQEQQRLAEVASARFRLDATLQHLVEKKDDSYPTSDGENAGLQPEFGTSTSPVQSPRKASKSRKRKRKDEAADLNSGSQHQTFVMKLFDRSVDLAQFDEDSPLYPICRAWIRNQPGNPNLHNRERTPTPEPPPQPSTSHDDEDTDVYPDVYHLPVAVKDEHSGLHSSCRIPAPLPQPQQKLNIHQDPDQAPPPEQLLLDHMVRWKQTRNSWRQAGFLNDMRYSGSMNLLRDMFERNMKDG